MIDPELSAAGVPFEEGLGPSPQQPQDPGPRAVPAPAPVVVEGDGVDLVASMCTYFPRNY
jgi:hypothetical protein